MLIFQPAMLVYWRGKGTFKLFFTTQNMGGCIGIFHAFHVPKICESWIATFKHAGKAVWIKFLGLALNFWLWSAQEIYFLCIVFGDEKILKASKMNLCDYLVLGANPWKPIKTTSVSHMTETWRRMQRVWKKVWGVENVGGITRGMQRYPVAKPGN